MKPMFKFLHLLFMMTPALASAVSPAALRDALQEKEFSRARQLVSEVLQNAQPTNKMPDQWAGTRGIIFESVPVGEYRVFASLPGGVLPDGATLRTLLASDVQAKTERSKIGNLIAAYTLPEGKGTLRLAMIRRDQTHLMADKNPKATDARFLMTRVPKANRAPDVYASPISASLRHRLIEAIEARDMPALVRRLTRTHLVAYKALIPHIETCHLPALNEGLKGLGLPIVGPAAEAKRYVIQDKRGDSYVLRPLKTSDGKLIPKLLRFLDPESVFSPASKPKVYVVKAYLERYKNHFVKTPIERQWVVLDQKEQRLIGLFDSDDYATAMVRPDYQGRGLGQAAHTALRGYFKKRLGLPEVGCETKPELENADEEHVMTPLLASPNFRVFSRRLVRVLDFHMKTYTGTDGEIAYTNLPSLAAFSKQGSIVRFESGAITFAFPPRAEDASLRALLNRLLAAKTEDERAVIRGEMTARQV